MRLLTAIVIGFFCAPAFATYNEHCLKLLQNPRARAIETFHENLRQSVENAMPSLKERTLGPVDYEAIFDLAFGLPSVMVFRNGDSLRLGFDRPSMNALVQKLGTTNVLSVLYLPQALDKIRHVLREACIHMNLDRCESYDDYMGLMDNRVRRFSRAQEQAIKWATIYQLPTLYTAERIKRESRSPDELRATVETSRRQHLESSRAILRAVFTPVNANEIFELFARNYINEAHDRLLGMGEDNVILFSR